MTDHHHPNHEAPAHDHGSTGHHHHPTPPAGFDSAFAIGSAINAAFVAAEVIFGLTAHSVALLADAAHNLGDVLGLLLAWWAVWLGRRGPTLSRTYGYGRSSILASLTNAVVLLIGVGGITVEAVRRLIEGVPSADVGGETVMVVAAIGILVNGVTALLFARGRKGDLNVKGAFLHMASDAVVSAGVVVSGLILVLTGWSWVDPIVSLLIAALILYSTWGLLRDSVNLALDKVPGNVDIEQVRTYLAALPGVTEVHDLHVWPLSTTETALTAHLIRPEAKHEDAFLHDACQALRARFNIGHSTLQIETGDVARPCQLAPAHVI
ncbi:cation diffusion facilitator family transporter [Pseudomonas sp. CCI3.2]|uniref:cation diffusion facilitator family transporter n=1 Tax=unclassified Pseudomonas TaxID=196821 RepID=UPI002AC8A42F|nr:MULTISPECIES: cation diffusion facilitator family transporter [unclassified Pseudomonas]MEB0078471.1 cation diffusion facilitator family transporter [Pseudomonas sp. MH10out]MEB0090123.1 cation diffusion facilitator family transporter [Pseudomonas sp. CCI4.2]MEB0103985.1 cation diffusion facilitator family transporter [Pseudomonas sp. CCI3.2]MEB0131746.1 cation diffusion facilitator family transporter [Pseudomonas sp. CCI2.4]MEB0158094.1 cation diffusion facilitator family transporter [Pseu